MKPNKKQIHEIIVNVLLECTEHVDNITTNDWVNIIKDKLSETYDVKKSDIQLSYRIVLAVLNELVEGDGYYNVITESNYVKGDEGLSGDGPNHSKYNFFYT